MKELSEPEIRRSRLNELIEVFNRKPYLKMLLLAAAGIIILLAVLWWNNRPLDQIEDYRVDVVTAPDGTLDITYSLRWRVLNDSKEGPLTWVQLGMANTDFTVLDYGGDISSRHKSSADYAGFNLKRSFQKGETAEFWFTVKQNQMLCMDPDDPSMVMHDFVPGWFPEIPVKHYRFTWRSDMPNHAQNADRKENGIWIWEGSLKQNGIRQMTVRYDGAAFPGGTRVTWYPFTQADSGGSLKTSKLTVLIVTFLVVMLFRFLRGGGVYRRGRGFGSWGSGGGGGCACAGCACACACAGGGRAGCSNKDFYKHEPDGEKPVPGLEKETVSGKL